MTYIVYLNRLDPEKKIQRRDVSLERHRYEQFSDAIRLRRIIPFVLLGDYLRSRRSICNQLACGVIP